MPNARPAFMEKVTLTSGTTDTWRFYPRQSVDTWEVLVNSSNTELTFVGITEDWSGEDWTISNGTKTVIATNTPSAFQKIPVTPTISTNSTDGEFAIDMGFKAIQVSCAGGGGATIFVKAYSKSNGSPSGSGYITGTALTA